MNMSVRHELLTAILSFIFMPSARIQGDMKGRCGVTAVT